MKNKHLYSEDWNDTIRPAILKRDNFRCKNCGIKHRSYIFIDQNQKRIIVDQKEHLELKHEGYRTYRIYLQVHHIDGNKANNLDNNLISLCNNCHYMEEKHILKLKRLTANK